MNLGKLGVFALFDNKTAAETAAFAKRVEAWGYSALWVWEGLGRDVMVSASWLLANTKTLNIATGSATIYARDPAGANSAQHALAEQSSGRFLLALTPSHKVSVEEGRGQTFRHSVVAMRDYLMRLSKTPYQAAPPAEKPKTLVTAFEPEILAMAKDGLADGAYFYNGTPACNARAREALGPGKLICAEQMVLLEKNPSEARVIGRRALAPYFALPSYRTHYMSLGFTAHDLDTGSDKLVDAIVAWGDETQIRKRLQEHWDAGADHVCIQAVPREGVLITDADEKILQLLAPSP